MRRGKAARRPPAEVPTGLLDAYTESPTASSMSDSDKFKEGYVKKKDKGKQKNRTAKKSETEEELEDDVAESWDAEESEVVDSWDQIDVEEQPVPQKVKATLRREEKKKKKEEKKASSQPPGDNVDNATSAAPSEPEPRMEVVEEPFVQKVAYKVGAVNQESDVVNEMEKLKVNDGGGKKPAREYSEEEKAAIKAEREAKKAAKANKKVSGNKEENKTAQPTSAGQGEGVAEGGKTKEQLKAERKAAFELQQKIKAESSAGAGETGAEKSKAELKAERRAKQEAQRAAKEAAQNKNQEQKPGNNKDSTVGGKESKVKVPDEIKADDKKTEKKLNKTLKDQKLVARTKVQRQIGLFSHLHQYERELSVTRDVRVVGGGVHPSIVQVGLQHGEGEVVGSSGRCVSLLLALKTLLLDSLQQLSESSDINKELDNLLKCNITFLRQCRQLSISMSNAIRYLKREVRQLEKNLSVEDLKTNLVDIIDDFININFTLHPKAISETANKKIRNGDVVLTYSHSKLVERVLLDAVVSGKKIKVIVSDGRPQQLGRRLTDRLVQAGVHTTYILSTAVSQVLPSVTKVLLGCDGVMANGCVLATVGTSQVALLAKSCNKPVTFFSETYKFTERVQTDSFVYNELLDPDTLVTTGGVETLSDWRDLSSLSLLHLVYDLTPASLVDSIVTEISEIPPTSVPVILRLHNYRDYHAQEEMMQ